MAATGPELVERLSTQVEHILQQRIESDTIIALAPAAVSNQAAEALREAALQPRQVAELVEQDALLAARVVRLSASAEGSSKRFSLRESCARIGVEKLRPFLVELSTQAHFVSRDAGIDEAARATWRHAIAVAKLARDVAAFAGAADPESAYVAGLLHDLGKPLVANLLLEAEKQITRANPNGWISADDWTAVVSRTHKTAGLALAASWELPEPIVQCIEESSKYDNADRASLQNCVTLANALSKKSGQYAGTVDLADVDALIETGRSLLGVPDEMLGKLGAVMQAA